jgi:xylulokinase
MCLSLPSVSPVVLGVDSSTSGCKVEVRDADTGALLSHGRAPHPPTTPPRSEQDPNDWEIAFRQACDAADVDRHRPAAAAIAGQQHGMVVLDARGDVLRPAKLWNDTESAPDAAWLIEHLEGGSAAWAAACGSVPVAAFTITKLSWLHRAEPETFARLATVLLPHDWLTFRLTGERVTDRGEASGTGYWSPSEDRYRLDLLRVVDAARDWAEAVPRVAEPTAAVGEWRSEHGSAIVAPGTGDNMAAALGLGLLPGDLAISVGTSGTVFAVSSRPTTDGRGYVAGFADGTGRFLPLVCTLNATKVTDTFARLLGVDLEGFDALALAAPPGAGGVTLVPYLDGERTPNRPDATGTLAGLRSDTGREELARAAVEGVVGGLLDGADALAECGVPIGEGRTFLVGGGARSPAYRRVIADLVGRQVLVPDASELVALGAAVQAASVLHQRPPPEVAAAWGCGAGTAVEPDGRVDRDAIRARYASLSQKIV